MNKEQLTGVVRHSLTFIGGLLVMHGYGDPDSWLAVVGSGVTLVGTLWSIFSKETVA
jgi:hypothetical protein